MTYIVLCARKWQLEHPSQVLRSVVLVHKEGNFHLRYGQQEKEAARAQEKGGKNDMITIQKKKKDDNSEQNRIKNGIDSELTAIG